MAEDAGLCKNQTCTKVEGVYKGAKKRDHQRGSENSLKKTPVGKWRVVYKGPKKGIKKRPSKGFQEFCKKKHLYESGGWYMRGQKKGSSKGVPEFFLKSHLGESGGWYKRGKKGTIRGGCKIL